MKLSKTGIKVLTAQYRAVLKKCLLINMGVFLFPSITLAATLEGSISGSRDVYTSINIDNKNSASIEDSRIIGNENDDFVFNKSNVTIKDSDLETKGNLQIMESTISYSCTSGNCEPDDDGPGDGFLAKNVTLKESVLTMGDRNNQGDYAYIGANKIFSIEGGSITLNSHAVLAYEGDLGDDGQGEFNISGSDTSGNAILTFNDYSSLRIGEADNISKAPLKISDSTITLNDYSFISFFGNEEDTKINNSTITLNDNSYISLNGLILTKAEINMKDTSKVEFTNVSLDSESKIKGNKNEVSFKGKVDFAGFFDPATANVYGNLTRSGFDDEIAYHLNSGTLKYSDDKYLYDSAKHTHNTGDTRQADGTFADGKYALNTLNFNGGTLDIANGKASEIKLAKLSLGNDSNIILDADLANKTMDRFSDDTTIESSAKLNISRLNLISDAAEEETTINFTEKAELLAATNYTGATTGLRALSPIYTYDVAYDEANGNFTFTRGSGSSVSDYNPAVYASSAVGHTVDFLQYNIADTTFNRLASKKTVAKEGMASGDISKANNTWVSVIGFDDNIDFDDFQTVDSEMMSVIGGVTSDIQQTALGQTIYGIYAGYMNGELEYDGNKINQEGGYLGLGTRIENSNLVAQSVINGGFIGNEDKHSFGTDKFDTYWAGIALKGGYDYKLTNGVTVQPNLYAGYTFVNNEDYISKSGAKIKNDKLHLFEVAPGLKISKDFENGWNTFAQAKYAFVMDNGGDVNIDSVTLPNISADDYVEYGVGVEKDLNDAWSLSTSVNRRDGGREGWNGNISFKYNF